MSTTVDNRIVRMQFDNAQFEQNAQKSMSTMEKLKSLMNFETSVKGLDKLSSASQNLKFDSISSGVETLTNRFSTLGIVGMTVLQNLTNSAVNAGKRLITAIPKQIMTGGWTRATNIENARFQLEGLGVAWKEIEEDLDYGVKDTAYGLDEAATVAAQLVASQVQVGDAMKQSLRAVSGVAAMTNSSYGDIGRIFTTVAGQGRLMADQLNQLAARGLNAAAVLAKHLNVTEAEVREMTSKGKIDFATFAEAMDDAFGEHAKEANKTFNGAFSNMKAALNRIGADFATPLRNNMRDVFNSTTQVFNAVRKGVKPFVGIFSDAVEKIAEKIIKFQEKSLKPMNKMFDAAAEKIRFFKYLLSTTGDVFTSLSRIKVFPQGLVDRVEKLVEALRYAKSVLAGDVKIFGSSFGDLKAEVRAINNLNKALTENEILSKNIQRTWNGVKAVFTMIGEAFAFIGEKTLPVLAEVLRDTFTTFFSVTAKIGDTLVKAEEYFSKFLEKQSEAINLLGIYKKIQNAVSSLVSYFKQLGDINISLPKFEGLKKIFNFEGLGKGLAAVITSIKDALKDLFSLDKIGSGFVKLMGSLGEGLAAFANALKGSDFINLVVNGALTMSLSNLLQALSNVFGSATGMKILVMEVKRALRDLSNSTSIYLQALATGVNANALLKLGIAIALIAMSFNMLAGIDSEKLASATAAIGVMLIGLTKTLSTLTVMKTGIIGMFKISSLASSLISISIAILVLSFAVERIGSLDLATLAKGLGAVAVSMLILVSASKLLSNSTRGMTKVAGSMVIFAIGLVILSEAVKRMGSIDTAELVKGLIAVGAAMAEVAGFAKLLGNSKIKVSTAISMIVIAAAMIIFAEAIERFGSLDWGVLAKGGAALAGILLSIAGFSQLAKGGTKMIAFGLAMILIASSMNIMVKAISKLVDINWETLGKAGAVLTSFMTIITAASRLSSGAGKLLALGISMVIMASSIGILAKAIAELASIPTDGLTNATLVMAIFMGLATGMMAIAGMLNPGSMLAVSASMLIMSVAMIALSSALERLGKLSLKELAIGLGAIAGSMVIIGLAGVLLAGAVVPILAIAGAAALLSIAMAGMATAVLALGSAAGIISVEIPSMLGGLGRGVAEFFKGLAESMATLGPALISIIAGISEVFVSSAPVIAQAIMAVVDALVNLVIEAAPKFVAAGTTMLVSLVSGIADNIGLIVEEAKNIIVNFINSIADSVGDIIQAGFNLVISLIEGIADALSSSENQARVQEAMKNLISGLLSMGLSVIFGGVSGFADAGKKLMDSGLVKGIASCIGNIKKKVTEGVRNAINGAKSLASEFFTIGVNFVQGLLNGIGSLAKSLWNKGVSLAKSLIGGAKAGTAEQSPSKEAFKIGEYFDQGLINGVTSLQNKVGKTAENIGSNMVDSLGSALSSAGDSFDPDYSPTITPVFDMTSISSGYDTISSIFSNSRAIDMSASVSGKMDANNVVLDYISKLDSANATRNKDVLGAFNKLSDDILSLGDRIENLELRLDSNKLVGGIAEKTDRAIGLRTMYERRNI